MTEPHPQWSLMLPYDRPPLSLNKNMHWAKQRELERQIMDDVQWLARAAKLPKGLRYVEITLLWAPSVKRTRDTDNPTPTLKKVIDGLVKYGLIPDDNHDVVRSSCMILPLIKGRGQVYVSIQQLDSL